MVMRMGREWYDHDRGRGWTRPTSPSPFYISELSHFAIDEGRA